jgi:hypothetical protein
MCLSTLAGHKKPVAQLALRGRLLYSAAGGIIRVWSTETFRWARACVPAAARAWGLEAGVPGAQGAPPVGPLLPLAAPPCTSSRPCTCPCTCPRPRRCLHAIRTSVYSGAIRSMAVSGDGTIYVSGPQGRCALLLLRALQPTVAAQLPLPGHPSCSASLTRTSPAAPHPRWATRTRPSSSTGCQHQPCPGAAQPCAPAAAT